MILHLQNILVVRKTLVSRFAAHLKSLSLTHSYGEEGISVVIFGVLTVDSFTYVHSVYEKAA
jgi:hypothetical protein